MPSTHNHHPRTGFEYHSCPACTEHYVRSHPELDVAVQHRPDGAILHVLGPTDHGGLVVRLTDDDLAEHRAAVVYGADPDGADLLGYLCAG